MFVLFGVTVNIPYSMSWGIYLSINATTTRRYAIKIEVAYPQWLKLGAYETRIINVKNLVL